MAALVVLYDACVLYPAPLRDLLMYLALTGFFQAKWSDQIHEEWIRNVLKNRSDLKREQLDRVRALKWFVGQCDPTPPNTPTLTTTPTNTNTPTLTPTATNSLTPLPTLTGVSTGTATVAG